EVAGHSKLMERAACEFLKEFENLPMNRPTKIFASNLTGEIAKDDVANASYWKWQLRNPVQFERCIYSLSAIFNHKVTFIEVGTGKGLSYFVNKLKSIEKFQSIRTVQLLPTLREVANSVNPGHQLVDTKEH